MLGFLLLIVILARILRFFAFPFASTSANGSIGGKLSPRISRRFSTSGLRFPAANSGSTTLFC